MQKSILVLLSILLVNYSYSQSNRQSILDSLFLDYYNQNKFVGQVLVGTMDHIIYTRSFGWANQEEQKKIINTTPIRLASISKTFTATSIFNTSRAGIITCRR